MPDLIIQENENLIRQDIITQTSGYNVSDRYVPIATQAVLDEIKDYTGIEPKITGFNNANVRKLEKNGFQKHAVICEMPNSDMLDGTKMNIILFNSNDRSTSLRIFMGAIRAACSNQCVWGDQIAEPVTIRHSNTQWKHSIYNLMDQYEDTQKATEDMIKQMMSKSISHYTVNDIIHQVSENILDPDITGSILDPNQLNNAHRVEDLGRDLWHTYQRIQYNLLQGGVDRVIQKIDDDGILFDHISKTHKVTDTAKQIEFNRALHKIVMEYA